jgi:phosphoribosylamine---glycine ligase
MSEARLESSKAFAKQFMKENGIPTARYQVFSEPDPAIDFARQLGGEVAVKVDGLASGKGVFVCDSPREAVRAINLILKEKAFGTSGERIVVEEKLQGEECSIMALCDGKRALAFGTARDYKRLYVGDEGPNTGGMGAFSPSDNVDFVQVTDIVDKIATPVVKASGFRGFLYLGIILTDAGPKVLEFNVRLGDPETQVILPRLEGDFLELLLSSGESTPEIKWSRSSSVTVVMCTYGYPSHPLVGDSISGIEAARKLQDVLVFHSGTRCDGRDYFTNGGRILSVSGLGATLSDAAETAYGAVSRISWRGEYHRKDIGRRSADMND